MKVQRIRRPLYKDVLKEICDGMDAKGAIRILEEALKEDNNAYIDLQNTYDDHDDPWPRLYVKWQKEYTEEEYAALKKEIKEEKERLKQLEEAALAAERETYLKLKAKFEG